MRIECIGISHKTAPLELREKFAFSPATLDRALHDLHDRWPAADFLLLSTCNRTELYTIRALHSHPRDMELRNWLGDTMGVAVESFNDALYAHYDEKAVKHIFSVAAGLDSLVPGEGQIVSQIKQALAAAQRASAARSSLATLIGETLRAAKEVRSETGIAEGKTSIASVAIDLIAQTMKTLEGKTIMSVGAGKMNEILLQKVRALHPKRIIVTNRSADRAEELADACGGQAKPMEQLEALLARADVVVTSTASEDFIITRRMLEQASGERPKLLIDIAVPRDIEPSAGLLPNVTLKNIDDLESTVSQTLQNRRQHLANASRIVNNHVSKFMKSVNIREVTPTIEAMYSRIDDIIAAEMTEAGNKLSTHDDAAEDMEIIRRTLWRAMRTFCHPAAENLRKAAATRAGGPHAKTIRKLFDLDTED